MVTGRERPQQCGDQSKMTILHPHDLAKNHEINHELRIPDFIKRQRISYHNDKTPIIIFELIRAMNEGAVYAENFIGRRR